MNYTQNAALNSSLRNNNQLLNDIIKELAGHQSTGAHTRPSEEQ